MENKKRRTRYFWLLSDQKTIRELSAIEYRKMAEADTRRLISTNYSRLLCRLHKSGELYLRTGRGGVWVARKQLEALFKLEA